MLLAVEDYAIGFRRYRTLLRQAEIMVLEGLSFGLERGEVLALVGASGAGKSLLAHALFGILPPNALTRGSLKLDGRALGPQSLAPRRMGLVPQSPSHLDPLQRCGRQLAWAARRRGLRPDAALVASTLARFGLEAAVTRAYPHQLSGGMARRLLLAMAAIGGPELIVADEPTGGLDPEHAAIVLAQLRRLADAGSGVLLITHDLAQALPFADRVALLRQGRLVGTEPAGAFTGAGEQLRLPYARALWRAMPQNAFIAGVGADA